MGRLGMGGDGRGREGRIGGKMESSRGGVKKRQESGTRLPVSGGPDILPMSARPLTGYLKRGTGYLFYLTSRKASVSGRPTSESFQRP